MRVSQGFADCCVGRTRCSGTTEGQSPSSLTNSCWAPIYMFRHQTGSWCNLTVHCPICSKPDMTDKSPGLKISTRQYWVIVIAPPTSNRKYYCQQKASHFWSLSLQEIRIMWSTLYIQHLLMCGRGSPWQTNDAMPNRQWDNTTDI